MNSVTRDKPKSITKCLIPPVRNMIAEQYLTPWSGEVELAQSFCADFLNIGSVITFADLSGVTITSHDGTAVLIVDGNDIKATTSGTCWNLKLSNGAELPLQGSLYDVSGHDFHGSSITSVNLYERQNSFHYNYNNGFDLYRSDTDVSIRNYIPYFSGVPVVASVAGYTKVSSHPAGDWHNGAETEIVIATTGHDGTGWVIPADIKAIDTEYLLHNEATGYGIPHTYTELQDFLVTESNYIFIDMSVENKRKNILLYKIPLTGTKLAKARKYTNYEASWAEVELRLTLATVGPTEADRTVEIDNIELDELGSIDWGDGNTTALIADTSTNLTHIYTTEGVYRAKISRNITEITLQNNRISGLNTADLRRADVAEFKVFGLGTADPISIDSSHMTSWIGRYWLIHSMPAGTYNIDSVDMTSWSGYYWNLHSMPAGTYNIDSSHTTSWSGYYWYLYSMPAGTYNIDSADMTSWNGYYWNLHSMPAGTYNIDSVDMTSWSGYYWNLHSMPAGTYLLAPDTFRNFTSNETLLIYDNIDSTTGLNMMTTTEVNKVINDIYQGRMTYTGTPSMSIAGTNGSISGVAITQVAHLRVGDDGVDTFNAWAITCNE